MLVTQAKSINLTHIFLIAAVGLFQTIPAIFYGIFDAYDLIPFHLKWAKHFATQFWSGDLYPRWLLEMNAGLGSPTFFFYPPVPYYFTSLFHPLFPHDIRGWCQLSVAAALALVASGITAYIWLKNITNQKAALIGSFLYMSLPYHTGFDLYWRFAYAEFWSFVWMPLVLYFTHKLITSHKLNTIGFAVSLALLSMTHLPTFIIFFPIPISYILFMANRQRKQALIRVFVAIILAVGLSAIYWLPAMTTQKYISMYKIMEGYYFYGSNFLFANSRGEEWRYLELLTPIVAGLVGCAALQNRDRGTAIERREANYWITVATISLFMTIPLSKPIWILIPVIQRLQYPWRFHALVTLATSAILTLFISQLQKPANLSKKQFLFGCLILLATGFVLAIFQVFPLIQHRFGGNEHFNTGLILFIMLIIILVFSYIKPIFKLELSRNSAIVILLVTSLVLSNGIIIRTRLDKEHDSSREWYSELESLLSLDAKEYRPKWVSEERFQPESLKEFGKGLADVVVTEGQGSLLIQRWKSREIALQVNAKTDLWLSVNQFYYPGWTARMKDGGRLLPVKPSPSAGLLRVEVPQGKHSMTVTLDAGMEERAGQIISTIFAFLAIFLVFWWRK